MGVDTHLRLQQLLNQMGGDYGKSQLKHLLAPIFAINPKQQALFYQAFDNYFDQFERVSLADENSLFTPPSPPPLSALLPKKRNYWLLAIVAFVLGLAVVGMEQKWELNEWRKEYSNRIVDLFLPTPDDQDSSSVISPQKPKPGRLNPPPDFTPSGKISLALKPELKEDIEHLVAKWYQHWGRWLQLLKWAVLLGVFIGYVVYQLYHRHKKQALLQRERNQAPPDYWNPLQVADTPKKLYGSDVFYQTAKEMRVRVKGDYQVLNVDKSIAATLESGGYPSFEYDDSSRPVEYLVLIEEQTPKDHQARFFDRLIQELAQQDVYIERYFYQNDPRHCWKVEYQIETNLYELAMRFPDHRLLVMGSGDAFLDGITEDILAWTERFRAWEARFLVTPKSTADWGFAEIQLANIFHVLPANIAALEKMDDTLAHPEQYPLKYWLSDDFSTSIEEPIEVKKLKQYFDEKTYQLLCACAVYPELHWDFTLHLAKKIEEIQTSVNTGNRAASIEEKTLLAPPNLLQLARLSWFREGYIPDAERQLLLDDLQHENENLTRESIVALLKENPPPTDSYAYNEYEMNLTVNEWELAKDESAKKAHAKALAELMERDHLLQFVRMKYQRSIQKIKDAFQLPEMVKENLFKEGIPILGLKNLVSGALVFLFLALVGWFVEVPKGEYLTEFEGEYYYLTDKRDTANFYHFKAQINDDLSDKRALLDTALRVDTNYVKARYNLALTYYDGQVGDGDEEDNILLNKAMAEFVGASRMYDVVLEQELENVSNVAMDISEVKFSPSDTCFATVEGKVVRLWNVYGELLTQYEGHVDKVTSVDFSEEMPWVLTASVDGTVKVWDLEGEELYSYTNYTKLNEAEQYASFVPNSNDMLVIYEGGAKVVADLVELNVVGSAIGEESEIQRIEIVSEGNQDIKKPFFSKSGENLLYAIRNQIVWKNTYTGETLQTFEQNSRAIAGFFLLDDLIQIGVWADLGILNIYDDKGKMHESQLPYNPYFAAMSKNQKYLFVADDMDDGFSRGLEVYRPRLTWNGQENWGMVKAELQKGNVGANNAPASNEEEGMVEYGFDRLNTDVRRIRGAGGMPLAVSPTGKYTLHTYRGVYLTEADLQSVAYSLYNLGVIQYNRQNYAQASSLFGQAHLTSPQDASILYARAVSNLYMDSLEAGLDDIAGVLDLDEQYFQFNLGILPLLQDLYLQSEGDLQEKVLNTLQDLGIDMENLKDLVEQQRFKRIFGEEWQGVYLMSSKFSNDKKWRNFSKVIIGADGTVRFNNDTIQGVTYSPVQDQETGILQWSMEEGNTSSAELRLYKDSYGNYKKEEWEFNRSGNVFNFFELQNQIIDRQYRLLKGISIRGTMTLEEETERQVRGWTFDSTPALLQSFYKDNAPGPNFNKNDYAYVSEPNQYGLMRVQAENGLWGLVNTKGQELIPPYYEGIGIFSEGLAGIQKNRKIGFINPEGEVVIKPQYDEVTIFKNGVATVIADGKTFEIDKKGNKLNELVQQVETPIESEPLVGSERLTEIGQYEQMKVKQVEDTRHQLLTPLGMVYVEGGALRGTKKRINDFHIDKYEVTNAQFANFLNEYGSDKVKNGTAEGTPLMKVHDRGFKNQGGKLGWQPVEGFENHPASYITWHGANEYARFYGKRLPTEEEWEYAAKGGKDSANYRYAGSNDVNQVAWYGRNSDGSTHAVGQKKGNELGIHDMSGNVAEWCADDVYEGKSRAKTARGGGFRQGAKNMLISSSTVMDLLETDREFGFRCVEDVNYKR